MRAYKFLDDDGRAPFTGVPWTPGVWVEARAAEPCREGVHACLPADLSHWLSAVLWEVELDGEVKATRRKLVASRGRLIRPVEGYVTAVRELAEVGAWRTRDRAVSGLGDRDSARRLAAATTLTEVAALGAGEDEATFGGRAAVLAADAAYVALHGTAPQAPFVAACSAGHLAAGPDGDQAAFDEGYAAERAFQSAWLADRLGL
jgi:hypothetical protein